MDAAGSSADALAVRAGRIVALGQADVRAMTGSRTELVDLRGRLLLPGFQDAHAHPVFGGLLRSRCDLTAASSAAGCLRIVGEHDGRGWVLGGGWDPALFPGGAPTATALDAVTGGRPAYLVNRDHHSVWVNTEALRLAGVDRGTPDPVDGWIERDADDRPSGTLHEGAADLVARVLPEPDPPEYAAALLDAQRLMHAHGVVGWQDAIVGEYLGYADTLGTYRDLDRRGMLTARVQGALWWDRRRGIEQVPDLVERRRLGRGDRFRAEHVKIMGDGVCENLTASLVQPYVGAHGCGLSYLSAEDLRSALAHLDAAGFSTHFHAVGDRAVRDALDAVAAARAAHGPMGLRHQIAHVQVVRDEDIGRFRELDVTANLQAAWAINDAAMTELTIPRLGAARSGRQYPFRSLLDSGAPLAAGSDWPVSEIDPLAAVHAAVNRTVPAAAAEPFQPEQAIGLTDALAAHTRGAARANGFAHETGSLEIGKAADLVVLDRDLLRVPPDEIGRARVDLTAVDGVVVHDRLG
ncbi:amidohydrolase [Saccharopolyspora sp. HNM0986]|uniref:amidohydrolase n=2 Tax=Saccharopolyspora TaxID=1835 RepID=UPI00190C5A3F|nr:amidohydrolase [Saccharopolyspora sp. HNM0986]MBK0868081.1 amidohydrolase [Saccharopolyspora sp. HNM0986]